MSRSQILANLTRQILKGMKPNCEGNRYSGQQIAYAKGQAWKKMQEAGF